MEGEEETEEPEEEEEEEETGALPEVAEQERETEVEWETVVVNSVVVNSPGDN